MLDRSRSVKLAPMEQAAKLARAESAKDWGLTLLSAALLVLAFPNFDLWPLAWIGIAPLLLAIARRPSPRRAFLLGWLAGSFFFYVTCYWLTFSIIHYGGIAPWMAYLLLIPGAVIMGLFVGVFAGVQAHLIRTWGVQAVFAAPVLWVALEWLRLQITGQLWNAIGYSQAFHPNLIQVAKWGGVYAVGFLIVAVNAAIVFALVRRSKLSLLLAVVVGATPLVLAAAIEVSGVFFAPGLPSDRSSMHVVALQPNVPMEFNKSNDEMSELLKRHLSESERGLSEVKRDGAPVLVIWPESPMNFTYGTDPQLREQLGEFARRNHVSLLFNSQEIAEPDGLYNSAMLINEEGRLAAQYDKIRLMPFGEYVPLPNWLPGSDRVSAIVGGFTAGTRYTLMPVGGMRARVFICIESAYPWIARTLTNEGTDVLINISNDGYLGPTAVMRQHLANAIFRGVENARPVLRVTNTGITAHITPHGEIEDATQGFQPVVRTWRVYGNGVGRTFYTKYGDVFVVACSILSLLLIAFSFKHGANARTR
jgi:apolipoprotein N-acyltransferase